MNPNVAIEWLLHYTENTMSSVTMKVHKLNKNIEQWILSGFQTMYTSVDYGFSIRVYVQIKWHQTLNKTWHTTRIFWNIQLDNADIKIGIFHFGNCLSTWSWPKTSIQDCSICTIYTKYCTLYWDNISLEKLAKEMLRKIGRCNSL